MRSLFVLPLAMLALLIGSAADLRAAELVARQGPWATECTPNITAEKHSCEVVARFVGSARPVQSFGYSTTGEMFIVEASAGVGRIRARVDDGPPFVFECSTGRCILDKARAAKLLEQVGSGEILFLENENQLGVQNVQDVGLGGFEAMYTRAETAQH